MNVIFLDIDGVVNTIMIGKEPFGEEGHKSICRDGYYYDLCHTSDGRVSNKTSVIWLEKICKDTNSKIVISSAWRIGSTAAEVAECLYNTGLDRDIEIIGSTPVLHNCSRGDEIQEWLNNHKEVEKFIILDDDSDMGELMDHLVKCDTDAGITHSIKNEALKLFEKL